MVVARLYACFEGKQRFLMLESLGAIYALLAILLWFAWKDTFNKKPYSSNVESDSLNSLISKNKKLSYRLMVYATSFVAANIFFFLVSRQFDIVV
jgi:membrane associated rhomboid family serine protease